MLAIILSCNHDSWLATNAPTAVGRTLAPGAPWANSPHPTISAMGRTLRTGCPWGEQSTPFNQPHVVHPRNTAVQRRVVVCVRVGDVSMQGGAAAMDTYEGTDVLPDMRTTISHAAVEWRMEDTVPDVTPPNAQAAPVVPLPPATDQDPYALTPEMRHGLHAYSMRRDGIL